MARPRKNQMPKLEPNRPHAWGHLAAWRENAKLTQEAVAALFDVSSVTIHRWENGKAPVTVENLMRLAEIYGARSITELTLAPSHKHLAADAAESMRLVTALPQDKRQTWLQVGRAMETSTDQN